mmetsp:Transcript_10085/g.26897  ORF Transcript_10085/g.26897 Transcript_10085/m.26897 type:complete len:208 (+) Transcript_10085:229-852(+)
MDRRPHAAAPRRACRVLSRHQEPDWVQGGPVDAGGRAQAAGQDPQPRQRRGQARAHHALRQGQGGVDAAAAHQGGAGVGDPRRVAVGRRPRQHGHRAVEQAQDARLRRRRDGAHQGDRDPQGARLGAGRRAHRDDRPEDGHRVHGRPRQDLGADAHQQLRDLLRPALQLWPGDRGRVRRRRRGQGLKAATDEHSHGLRRSWPEAAWP